MDKEKINKLNVYLDFNKKRASEIIEYCGLHQEVVLSPSEQLTLFGFLFKRGHVSIICNTFGVIITGNDDIPVTSYSWHGLITPLLQYIHSE